MTANIKYSSCGAVAMHPELPDTKEPPLIKPQVHVKRRMRKERLSCKYPDCKTGHVGSNEPVPGIKVYNIRQKSCPAPVAELCTSRSGYPPWILKRGGLESSAKTNLLRWHN